MVYHLQLIYLKLMMDCCAFARATIIGYTSLHHCIGEDDEGKQVRVYSTYKSMRERCAAYVQQFGEYNNMCLPELQMKNFMNKVISASGKNSHWKGSNKSKEKENFLNYFSPSGWKNLNEAERQGHTLKDCKDCNKHQEKNLFRGKFKKVQQTPGAVIDGILQ